MRQRTFGAMALALVLSPAAASLAQTVGPQNPPLVIRSLAGKDSFEFYCSSCHGKSGDGHGPSAARLATPPPDLRLLSRRNGGEFPRQQVLEYVTNGEDVARDHGTREMLPWGPAFRGLDRSDSLVTIRIANIVDYLKSLQLKP